MNKLAAFTMAAIVGLCLGCESPIAAADPPAASPATLKAACDRGNAESCGHLAGRYSDGEGVKKDPAVALGLSLRACTLGRGIDCALAGSAYMDGDGVSKDPARAIGLWQRGCDLNDAFACDYLGMAYEKGKGVAANPAMALDLFERSCRLGGRICSGTEYDLYELYFKLQMSGPPIPNGATLQKECDQEGLGESCFLLGMRFEYGDGADRSLIDAAKYYSLACEADYPEGCWFFGNKMSGPGLSGPSDKPRDSRDDAVAANAYLKGCTKGHGTSCSLLGAMFRHGVGAEKNVAQADELREIGCLRGSMICPEDMATAAKARAGAKASAAPASQAKPATAAPKGPPATPAVKLANATCKVAGVQLGVDTVASVERDIQARGGSPLTGGSGPAKYRVSTMSGDYQDAGFDPMAVNYDFDAAGPAGRLVAVTIANKANTGPGYETLLASRKAAAAAIAGPLQQKSATELVASGPGCQLRLLPNAGTFFIYEVYQLPN